MLQVDAGVDDSRRAGMRALAQAVLMIAAADITLQVDNALAISSLASAVPPSVRLLALAGGVGLGAVCLTGFTLLGSTLLSRAGVLKPAAGLVLVLLGVQLIASYFNVRLTPWR